MVENFYSQIRVQTIDQFSNLISIKPGFWDIMASYRLGTNFFVREILDGIVAKPGGAHITRRCEHRQVLQQSRQVFHGQKICFLGHNIPESWFY